MAEIVVTIPDDIAHYAGDLRYFMDSMVRKLHVSRHKGFAEGMSVDDVLRGCNREENEFIEAVRKSEPQFNAYMEAVDTANMWFIMALVVSRMTKPEWMEASFD